MDICKLIVPVHQDKKAEASGTWWSYEVHKEINARKIVIGLLLLLLHNPGPPAQRMAPSTFKMDLPTSINMIKTISPTDPNLNLDNPSQIGRPAASKVSR